MTDRDNLVLEARRLFVAWANAQEPIEDIRLDADDTDYFYLPSIQSDTLLGSYDRLLHVYQGLNDELHSVEFVIFCDDHYKEVKALIIEADTNYSVVKAPE